MWQSQLGAVLKGTQRVERFVGASWYVDGVNGIDANNSNSGLFPLTAFKTLGFALSKVGNGDQILIKAGMYDESGLEVTQNGLCLCGEWGTTLSNSGAGSEVLLVSGASCKITQLNIAQAGKIGLNIAGGGVNCRYESAAIIAATVAVDINASACIIDQVFCSGYTVTGIDVSTPSNLLRDISVNGGGTAVRGIYLSNAAADNNTLRGIFSAGNATTSIEMVPGCTGNTVYGSSSGAGDGRWIDGDNVWSLDFADEVFHTTTFTGAGPSADNIFKVIGTVEIDWIYSDVEVASSADVGNVYLEVYDGAPQDVITKSPGPSAASLGVGSTLLKTAGAASDLTILNSDQGRIAESSNNKPKVSFIVQQKNGADTYIRFVYSGVATSGTVHWHCRFDPLTENGWLESV